MKTKKSTRERVLEAACQIFANKGFHDTTVADICETAGANIAAVNYHFGDKESLYDAVWRYAFKITSSTYPIDADLPPNPTLKDYIYSHCNAVVHRVFCEEEAGLFPKLLHREISNPTLALDRIEQEVLFPQSMFLGKKVHEELKNHLAEKQIRLCMHSIIGQCVFFNFNRPLRERVLGKKILSEAEKVELARHISTFSMGGIKELMNENK